MITFPNINPVALAIGPLKVHWYGVAYVVGILLACRIGRNLIKRYNLNLPTRVLDDLFPFAVIGIIIGGRLGHVLFYDAVYYLNNPLEIPQVWLGGMSFHGGLIGVATMTYIFTKKHAIDFFTLGDLLALISPIGLFFGRIANFINAELYGITTTLPFGVVFPNETYPRHATQIYEALLEGLALFLVLNLAYKRSIKLRNSKGATGCLFLCFYALFRLSVEPFKVQEVILQLGTYSFGVGVILCTLMLLLSILLLKIRLHAYKNIS
jgi:phosphatidylglycerol:prolipoprotein diacylglycerol transferase